jgi:hypothetical protein
MKGKISLTTVKEAYQRRFDPQIPGYTLFRL